MDGEATTKSPFWGAFGYAVRSPEIVASVGEEEGEGEGGGQKEHPMEDKMTEGPDGTGEDEKADSRGDTLTKASNWEMVVELVQTALGEGRLAEDATWQAVVLITKGGKYYRGIGLVEVMCLHAQ